ncbi:hypothetical protein DGo_PC0146 (plasmid) [Deinococcus gobiensis I-0]|uniref:Uncharacterized protein n=1 Tax=Deinococcus gobiensis (strain DSM 21396 / JCM 16679 / CGMCC 1.7299 / I-0) TaxID=745776 RepID=H8H341_DEIGI|nr:hypothetical protein DGo_PC0146 [Deinococcus gobiensis I-0]
MIGMGSETVPQFLLEPQLVVGGAVAYVALLKQLGFEAGTHEEREGGAL